MRCYECCGVGRNQEAIGLCHHCSAALCRGHACVVADPIAATYPIAKKIVLPKRARLILCETCLAALEQARPGERTREKSEASMPVAG